MSVGKIQNLTFQDFKKENFLLEKKKFFFVVKSKNQTLRRKQMIMSKIKGKFGRLKPRPVARGLLAIMIFKKGSCQEIYKKSFYEPRHIVKINSIDYALTEIDRVNVIDKKGDVKSIIKNELFAYLHSIDLKKKSNLILVCSSGYDTVLQLSLVTKKIVSKWCAWEDSFKYDENGNQLFLDKKKYLLSKKKKKIFVDIKKFGKQGIDTRLRTAHPNVAVYNPYKKNSIIVSIGHAGQLVEIDLIKNKIIKKINIGLSSMPHGIKTYNKGWMITNTTKGEFIILSKNFKILKKIKISSFPDNITKIKGIEWLQNTIAIRNNLFLCIDANRGLICLDIKNFKYCIYQINKEWCVQDALEIS